MSPELAPHPAVENSMRAPRWTPGTALLLIGLVHLAAGPLFYPDSLRSIVDGGVVGAVESDPVLLHVRSAGFWYLTSGLGMLIGAVLMRSAERRGTGLPRSLPWLLAGTAVWGILLMPLSGFWAILAVAIWAFIRGATAKQVPSGDLCPENNVPHEGSAR